MQISKPLLSNLVVLSLLAVYESIAAPARAEPLNPLDFPSLGNVTLSRGTFVIDTVSKTPNLMGPDINLSGTVSASGVAVFRFDDLTVSPCATITSAKLTGATRPVALLASGNLTFAGKFDAKGANGTTGSQALGGVGGEGRFGGTSGTNARGAKPGGVPGSLSEVEPSVRLVGGSGGGGGLFRRSAPGAAEVVQAGAPSS